MMSTTSKAQAELVAEQYAVYFLKKQLGEEIFLGSEIEQILAKKAAIIYQNVDDPTYFGAAIHLLDKHFIAINTAQPLRLRYYNAAHELWHLQYESEDIPMAQREDFDHERAADHFAASVMLPEGLVRTLLHSLNESPERLVIKIADLSSMPYEAVTRRLKELGERIPVSVQKRSEAGWRLVRSNLGFPPSVLDKSDPFIQFSALSKETEQQVDKEEITLEMAANLIKHIDPKQAENYWDQRQKLMDDWIEDD